MFLALTETHLKGQYDAEIWIENYTVLRTDRRKRKGGGVALYIKNEVLYDHEKTVSFSDDVNDLLITTLVNENLIIILLYRPPDEKETSPLKFNTIFNKIREYIEGRQEDVLLIGDFNFPKIIWDTYTLGGRTTNEKAQGEILLNFVNEYSMTQFVSAPTRKKNTLDLVITNNAQMIHSVIITPTILSDHDMVEVNFQKTESKTSKKQFHGSNSDSDPLRKLNFHNDTIDWSAVNESLENIQWQDMSDLNTVDQMLNFLMEKIKTLCATYIPLRRKNSDPKKHIPRDRRILMRNRTKVKKNLMRDSANPRHLNKLKYIENQITQSLELEKRRQESQALAAMKTNPRYFFRYAKNKLVRKDKIGPLIRPNKQIITEPKETADEFMKIFKSAFSTPMEIKLVSDAESFFNENPLSSTQNLMDIQFSTNDIEKAIDQLKPDAAPGPDSIPAILLKKCKKTISKPLYILWKKSLESGEVPQSLKHGLITPIFKKGSKGDPANYRPVTLTSHLVKVFERVLASRLMDFMETHNKFNPHQHGFRRGRSCLSQLLQHRTDILGGLADGAQVDVIYLDYAKAFDKVDHGILHHKIKDVGIGGKVGVWLYNFLKNRTQQVTVDEALSDICPVISGVPQGTVLGPLLFLIMVGDIDKGICSSTLSSFADDSRLMKMIEQLGETILLQRDLITVEDWTKENNMSFNYDKFEALRYGMQEENQVQYTINGNPIKELENVKDLGIWFTKDGSFKYHISQACILGNKMVGWMLRTFTTRDPTYLVPLFKSLVISRLEYCCQLWSPHAVNEIQQLENVQRIFTRRLIGSDHNYWERLKILNLYSLQRRRERYIIIYIWKILEGQVPNPNNQIVQIANGHRGRRCIRHNLPKTKASLQTLLDHSFIHNGPKLFNCLPSRVRNLTNCSVITFKNNLDKFLKTIRDEPPVTNSPMHRSASSNSIPDQLTAAIAAAPLS